MLRALRSFLIDLAIAVLCFSSQAYGQTTYPTATLTVSGVEKQTSGGWDAGSIQVIVNGYVEVVQYGQYSSNASLASALAAMFWRDYHQAGLYAKAGANGTAPSVITFQLNAGSTFDTLDVVDPSVSFTFAETGFPSSIGESGGTLYDSGAVTFAVNGRSEVVPYGQNLNATNVALADALAAAINNDPSAAVTASPEPAYYYNGNSTEYGLLIAVKASGPSTEYSWIFTDSYDSIDFSQPSFTASPSSGTFVGSTSPVGQRQNVYSYSIAQPTGGGSGYSANGNVIAYTDSVNGAWQLGYDSLNRLAVGMTAAPGGSSLLYYCWTYDGFGNRMGQATSSVPFFGEAPSAQPLTNGGCITEPYATTTVSSATYNASNQIVSWVGNGSILAPAYDAAGNITNDGSFSSAGPHTYVYDAEGRICAESSVPITGGVAMVQYLYDADGNRVAKGTISSMSCDTTVNGFTLTNQYLLGLGGEQVIELNGSGNWVHVNVFAGGSLMATYYNDGNGVHFQLTDWLGTRRMQTDYEGTPEDAWTSLPFGDSLTQIYGTVPDATEQHYTGKERDAESGLDYFGARYYGSNMGRFMSPDWSAKIEPVPYSKLDDPQSLNLYSYVRNNPLSRRDLDGHADVAAMCKGQATCKATVTDTVNIVHYDKKTGNTVVDSTLKVTTNFNVTTDAKGNMSATASSTVSNVSGHAYSDGQLATMGKDIGAMQGAAVTMGFGANTTQLMTAVGAVETRFGAADPAKGSPSYMNPAINPMQLTGGNGANMNMMHNIDGAMGVFDWAGSRSDFDPTATYSRYSDHSVPTMANWGSTYNSISEQVQPPQQ